MQLEQELKLKVDKDSPTPLFRQISDQIRQAIANRQIQPGQRLPTVRNIAQTLQVNLGTVVRAYLELEQQKVISSHRGGGTTVIAAATDPAIIRLRHSQLSNLVSDSVLTAFSYGYSPDELEAAFSLELSRWQESHRQGEEEAKTKRSKPVDLNGIVIVASHDMALNLLVNKLKTQAPNTRIEITYAGSLGGLIALQQGRSNLAGIHLLDEETGEYNYPYLRHLLPGRRLAVVHLVDRIQGLMVAKGNPKNVNGFADLKRDDIVFVNRQAGSGTRVLLDFQLRRNGIEPSQIRGYAREVDTHTAVAAWITAGRADVGLGIEAAAQGNEIDFLPLLKERYDLVLPLECHKSKAFSPLLDIVNSAKFKSVVAHIGGYDMSQTGSVTFFP